MSTTDHQEAQKNEGGDARPLPSRPASETGGRGGLPRPPKSRLYGTWSPWQVVGNAELTAPGMTTPLAVLPPAL